MDPFVDGNGHNMSVDSNDFVESNPSNNYTSNQNGSKSTTPDSGVSASDSLPSDELEQLNGHVSSSSSTPQPAFVAHSSNESPRIDRQIRPSPFFGRSDSPQSTLVAHSPKGPPRVDRQIQHSPVPGRSVTPQSTVVAHSPKGSPQVDRQIQPSPVIDRSDSPRLSQSSYSHTSSKESLQLKEDRNFYGSRSPIASSQESLNSFHARLSTGGGSETNISGRGSHPNLSQQSSGSCRQSQESLSPSPKPKENRRSGRSSNASFQEVVIVESNEPVLQVNSLMLLGLIVITKSFRFRTTFDPNQLFYNGLRLAHI